MIRIIADENIPFLKGVLEPFAYVRYLKGSRITKEEVASADALLIRTRTRCDRNLLEGSPVKFIASATIGIDHINTGYCDASGITWINAPGCNADSVMQYIGSVLASWSLLKDRSPEKKTIGIVGAGHVGSRVAMLANVLGMKVLQNDPPRERLEGSAAFVSLDELLSRADIVTLHVPLNRSGADATFHLFKRENFAGMKPGAWFINASRGEVVDEMALKQAIEGGSISCSALDVWENEPAIDRRLLSLVTIGTPHIAGYSVDGKRNGTVTVVRALAKHFGFGLHDWQPDLLPGPADPLITLDKIRQADWKAICNAILETYDVMKDDARLRTDPDGFEAQRGSYPVRREFPYFRIRHRTADFRTKAILTMLGFTIAG